MPPRKKKQKNFLGPILILLALCMLAGGGYIAFLWYEATRTSMVRYPAFGIDMPAQYGIHGIDVSRYQSRISWEAVREMEVGGIRLGFAFIKATEGADSKDPFFRRNWEKSRDAGIVRGAYHFYNPAKKGRPQAMNFIRSVKLEHGDLPPVLDIETIGNTNPTQLRKELQSWLDAIEAHYAIRPLIYTNIYFYNRYLQGHFDNYPLWVAHYLQPNAPRIQRSWSFWQHSETGRVNGITSRVDFNVFAGDSLAFRSLLVP